MAMKRHASLAVVVVAFAATACQRPATRTADAGSPSASPAAPAAAASPAPAEAPPAAVPVEAPAAAPPAGSQPQGAPAPAATVAATAPAAAAASAPAVEPTPTPTPEPTPTPRPRIVATGTPLSIVLQQGVSTKTAKAEDEVLAELAADVSVDGDVLLPRGSEVRGHVVSALRSGRVKGRAQLVVAFDEIRFDGRSYKISTTGFDVTAGSSKGKDAKIAGGAAAAGAVIGAIADGGSGALKGGLIGGAAGGAAVLATRGAEVELAAGSSYTIKLQKSLQLR
jgi:type IV secretory pathway VirB10-like protein